MMRTALYLQFAALVAPVLLAAPSTGVAGQEPLPVTTPLTGPTANRLQLSHLTDIAYPDAPAISPSGREIAFVSYRANLDENRWDGALMVVDVASGQARPLAPDLWGIDRPLWSPSGDRLAFLAADEDGTTQLWVMAPNGTDLQQVTREPLDVVFHRWSPDGRAFVFGRPDEPEPRSGPERHNRAFVVRPDSYLNRGGPAPLHLWWIPATGGEARRLTSGERTFFGAEWAPDGQSLLVESAPNTFGPVWVQSAIHRLDLRSGELEPFVEEGFPFQPRFSPDGRSVALLASRGGDPDADPSGAYLVVAEDGAPREATAGIDRDLGDLAWLPDGRRLLVSGPDGTSVGVWLQPLDGPARRLDLGSVDPLTSLSVSGDGRVAFMGTEPHRPMELYVMGGPDWTPRRITGFNDRIAALELGRVETLTWESPDGLEMDGVLIYPPGFGEGARYPLVVHLHGGPYYTDIEGFSPTFTAFRGMDQLFAAQGWLVFKPNFRGSNNRGVAFQRAIVDDVGEGPARDVLSGIEALQARGIVDEGRVALAGWSYGGYLAAWLNAHHDRWAAAVLGAADADFVDSYSASDLSAGNASSGWLGGSPWRNGNLENYRRQSLVTHAHRIRTPTLILSNTGDARVPIIGSYKLFHALRDNGVEVEFVAYPLGGHFPGDPVHRQDLIRRWIEWISRHFGQAESSGGSG